VSFDLRTISELFSFRDLRNILLGSIVLIGGVGLSALTLYAHQSGNARLAGISAAFSLVFVLLIIIFVVPPLARNAGKEASQMNLPFDLTIGGAIIFGLVVIVGFSAWNTGNNLLFLILSFLAATLIVGFIVGNASLKRIDVKMRFPETIVAGDETPILVILHNKKRVFPTYSVVSEVRGTERERSVVADDLEKILPHWLASRLARPPVVRRTLNYFVHVPRSSYLEEKVDHIFENRGRFLIRDFELTTRFPFGFFRHRRRLPAKETELIVFPRAEPADVSLLDLPLEAGRLTANRRGPGSDLLALRDYEHNDDLRRIDWKATARTQQLTVREFSAEDERRVTVVLDTRVPPESHSTLREKIEAEQSGVSLAASERFERGVSKAASIVTYFLEEKALVKLRIGDLEADFGTGTRHLYRCLKALALAEPVFDGKPPSTEDLLKEVPDSHLIVVSADTAEATLAKTAENITVIRF
jgi:uncharacterized protein (DUF58 family)